MEKVKNQKKGRFYLKYKFSITLILCSFFSFTLIAGTVIAALPTNPLSFSPDSTNKIKAVYYQGWGFFSKSTRDPMLNAIPLENEESLSWPNNRVKNLFGVSRLGRSQGIEFGSIIAQVQPSEYTECKQNVKDCFDEIEVTKIIENPNKNPRICGLWGVSNTEPVPWAWGKSKNKVVMPSKIAKVKIICSKN
jgi:antimicrobial peptide system SdpA family protein